MNLKGIDAFVKILSQWRRKEGRKEGGRKFQSLEVRASISHLKIEDDPENSNFNKLTIWHYGNSKKAKIIFYHVQSKNYRAHLKLVLINLFTYSFSDRDR